MFRTLGLVLPRTAVRAARVPLGRRCGAAFAARADGVEVLRDGLDDAEPAYALQARRDRAAQLAVGTQHLPDEYGRRMMVYLRDVSRKRLARDASRIAYRMRERTNSRQHLEATMRRDEDFKQLMLSRDKRQDADGDGAVAAADERIRWIEPEVGAYVASRLPSIYGAVYRVLNEVARRLPDLRIRAMLDYGSGPGTAIWAASELWHLSSVTAVEASPAMREAGAFFVRGIGGLDDVLWLPGIEDPGRDLFAARQDLVTCSYVLSEQRSDSGRAALVRKLWNMTADVLVIIEPGTPKGFLNVAAARQLILDENAGEVHVVAPCPHDGVCPLVGSKSWCHFVQRSYRPATQRAVKKSARLDYEDEKFSFVVLRRGPSPRTTGVIAEQPIPAGDVPSASVAADSDGDDDVSDAADGPDDEGDEAEDNRMRAEDAVASFSWARMIRRPLLKTRHVIVDVCTPAGDVRRQTIGKASGRDAGYRHARTASWGDLWQYWDRKKGTGRTRKAAK